MSTYVMLLPNIKGIYRDINVIYFILQPYFEGTASEIYPIHCTQCKYIPLMFDTPRVAYSLHIKMSICMVRSVFSVHVFDGLEFRQHFLATASLLGVWNPSGSITTIDQNALLRHGEENMQVFVLTFLLALLVFLEHHV